MQQHLERQRVGHCSLAVGLRKKQRIMREPTSWREDSQEMEVCACVCFKESLCECAACCNE
eukprot:302171-Rhodomonas_salina.1